LPFDSNAFDAATMGYGLRNVTDIPRSLREIHRVLKPGQGMGSLKLSLRREECENGLSSFDAYLRRDCTKIETGLDFRSNG
jgi:ubiquinone/menaquinone biosynthesis C-methylase UbiE